MLTRITTLLSLALFTAVSALAQDKACVAWNTLPQQDANKAEELHVIYRDAIKAKDYKAAFPLWKQVYEMAPAADGKRPFHYTDGRTLYLDLYANETDPAKKDEYAAMIARLYEEERKCYPGSEAQSLGLQVYDMFYTMQRPYTETYPIALRAMDTGGDKTDFRVITPVGYLVAYMFSNKLIDQPEARRIIEQARGIVTNNQAGPKAADYTAANDAANAAIASVERNVFDCAYFKAKLEPAYRADPNNPAVYQDVYTQLLQVGCSKDDPLLAEIGAKDRAAKMAEYEANNPMIVAKKMMEQGDMDGALAKLNETAAAESNPETKAAIYLNIASIVRKEGQKSQARNYARKALDAKPGYGKAYIMIGDLYASSSASCSSDPFQQRLVIIAALNQYAQAKSDPESASTAQDRISKYSRSLPTTEMLFERGIKPGESRSTGCWVGETVSVRAN